MAYVCKNCGKLITQEEYDKYLSEDNSGIGCFLWIIFILLCVSVILIPIAIILLFMHYNKGTSNNKCPYCQAKDSLILEDTPIAQTILKETGLLNNVNSDEISNNQDNEVSEPNDVNTPILFVNNKNKKAVEPDKKHSSIFFWILFIFIGIGLYNSIQDKIYEEPRSADVISCKNYKHLCIAEFDIKYTAVKDNTRYYNGWLGAINACKAWGGRLPYTDELLVLKEAFENKIVRRSNENDYFLSGTSYNTEKVYALNLSDIPHSNDITTVDKHLKPYVTEFGIIQPDPDKYGFSARCVKNK